MSDVSDAGSAPAPAESHASPITETAPQTQPLGSQTPVAEKPPAPEKPAAPKPLSEALRDASAAVKAKAEAKVAAEAKPDTKPLPKEAPKTETPAVARARAEDGKFAPRTPATGEAVQAKEAAPAPDTQQKSTSPHREAPARFSADAKAAWEAAPDSIKAETHRALTELEEGHKKYKENAERYEKVREFDELARKNGREGVHESLKQVVELEKAFERSPIEGFQKVADHFGISLRAVATHILGQDPNSTATQQDQTIRALQAKLEKLEGSLGTVTKTFEQQKTNEVLAQVDAFAKEHPRFDELYEDIAFFLTSGRTSDLAEAYTLAERLNPAPASSASTPAEPVPASPAQLNPAGSKSISGAPSTGSNPPERKGPIPSSREALRRAMAQAG